MRDFPRPGAVPDAVNFQLFRGEEPLRHAFDNSCAGRRRKLEGYVGKKGWILPEDLARRGAGQRKLAVLGLDDSPVSQFYRRGIDCLYSGFFKADSRPDNIDDGVKRTHFVEVNFLDGRIVDLGLRLRHLHENIPGIGFYPVAQ